MSTSLAPLIEALRRHTPAEVDGGEITIGSAEPPIWCDDEGRLIVSIRTIVREDGVPTDVREMEVGLGRFADQPAAKLSASNREGSASTCVNMNRSQGKLPSRPSTKQTTTSPRSARPASAAIRIYPRTSRGRASTASR